MPGNAWVRACSTPLSRAGNEAIGLDAADPFPVFPDGFERSEIAAIQKVLGGGDEFSSPGVVPGIAGTDGDKLQHAGIAIAIDHTPRAAIPNQLRAVEFINVAHRLFPEMAA